MYLPKKYDISSGFVINSENQISTQCDLIIYDKDNTPQIESFEKQKFFPVETIVAIGEVKSDINSALELNEYLEKLSKVKKMREGVKKPRTYFRPFSGPYNPSINPYDSIFTFIICNKFNFNTSENFIRYESDRKYKHNLVLSLEDGLINYKSKNGDPNLSVPFIKEEDNMETILRNDGKELPSHILLFLASFNMATTFTSLLDIDMTYYLTDEIYEEFK